ncbi:MAG: DUF2585 family protein [Rhizobiaceae bacterium]|nr:DUF2585 family protein [Rhizobiaceae bacterium]
MADLGNILFVTERLQPTPLPAPEGDDRPFRASRSSQGLIGLGIFLTMIAGLVFMGRPLICPCGIVSFWQGPLTQAENSQQFSDWYSLLHAVFGAGLYAFVTLLRPIWKTSEKLLAALLGSALWEGMENTPFLIGLFSDSPNAPDYFGDTILNATGDTLFVLLGFSIAARLPLPATLALAVFAEVAVTLAVDDGLVLGSLRLLGINV